MLNTLSIIHRSFSAVLVYVTKFIGFWDGVFGVGFPIFTWPVLGIGYTMKK